MQHDKPDDGNATVVLQWIGDISLNGLYCDPRCHPDLSSNMAMVAAELGPCDLRIANWESPLWGGQGLNTFKTSPLTCTTEDASECLRPLGLNVGLLANNHIYDCLEKGVERTIRHLEQNQVHWLGVGRSREQAAEPLALTCRGLSLRFLNYVGSETNPRLPTGARVFINTLDVERMLADVESLSKQADAVFVALHWGEVELISFPTVEQRMIARQAIEAGARVVACHHAHCLQGHEQWGKGHIFYGLGNFLFDGCFCAKPGRFWPRISRRVGVATTAVSRDGVVWADMHHFSQEGLLLRPDASDSRRQRQARLDRSVQLSDRRLRRRFAWAFRVQMLIVAPWRFIWKSGGPIRAVRLLRWEHVTRFLWAIRGR